MLRDLPQVVVRLPLGGCVLAVVFSLGYLGAHPLTPNIKPTPTPPPPLPIKGFQEFTKFGAAAFEGVQVTSFKLSGLKTQPRTAESKGP